MQYTALTHSFPSLEPVHCSMCGSNWSKPSFNSMLTVEAKWQRTYFIFNFSNLITKYKFYFTTSSSFWYSNFLITKKIDNTFWELNAIRLAPTWMYYVSFVCCTYTACTCAALSLRANPHLFLPFLLYMK